MNSQNRCVFCDTKNLEIILKNHLCYAVFDKYPVNRGHILIVPYRHFASFFDANREEVLAIHDLINDARVFLDREFSPAAYNIGVNVGEVAGQTIMHMHIHLIPRYEGDIRNPRGGVRGVIPSRRIYPF
ncbi:HIT family protein [Hippea maritima]|uniref:Histidine triad (HIT) protein n=1 Tax=Hippea maritima (strain ATCC 700847 / DSM 10411 / MH2) TaxID=760142 RepID=F2LTM9_HIPMA|nr:HIT family protein [Hippea maritima]AEA33354.1 histidine triad (HIT) protein [Hippea maritima DSM 10411]